MQLPDTLRRQAFVIIAPVFMTPRGWARIIVRNHETRERWQGNGPGQHCRCRTYMTQVGMFKKSLEGVYPGEHWNTQMCSVRWLDFHRPFEHASLYNGFMASDTLGNFQVGLLNHIASFLKVPFTTTISHLDPLSRDTSPHPLASS